MFEQSRSPSPDGALVSVPTEWQPILQASNQVVLYNPTNHALVIRSSGTMQRTSDLPGLCPYCHRILSAASPPEDVDVEEDVFHEHASSSRVPDYFQLLEVANETYSRPSSPPGSPEEEEDVGAFAKETMAEGYFKAFFREECKLGMGANGSVFLCQHILDGNPLGHFAVKKIAVGQSHSYLLDTLREVRLLEKFHHPNIISYHHSWLETYQFSSFGPRVPTLHVLMQWAEGGSLDDFIDARQGRSAHPAPSEGGGPQSRAARIRAFRALQRAQPEERTHARAQWTPVHLLSAEEVRSLFSDVVEGLAFLHDKSVLHLDLKPGNVLLTWDDGKLVPRAMLSDFGTSRDMVQSALRSGNTGTLEYTAPESLRSAAGTLQQVDSKADMWALGMILHKMLFFRLPYQNATDAAETEGRLERLEQEIAEYPGFRSSAAAAESFESRRLPRAYLVLLESLLNPVPHARPAAERVLAAIRGGGLEPLPEAAQRGGGPLVPVLRRASPETVLGVRPRSRSPGPSAHIASMSVDRELDGLKEGERTPRLEAEGEKEKPVPRDVVVGSGQTRRMMVRGAKSAILAAKVYSLPRAHPALSSLLLALALADSSVDNGWGTSLALSAAHVVALQWLDW